MKRRIVGLMVTAALLLLPVMVWGAASATSFVDSTSAEVNEYRIGELVDVRSRIFLRVVDQDENVNPAAQETVLVYLYNPITNDFVDNILLQETGNATGIFDNFFRVGTANENLIPVLVPPTGAPITTDERLEANIGDVVWVRYVDDDDANDSCQDGVNVVSGPVRLYEGSATLANLKGAYIRIDNRVAAPADRGPIASAAAGGLANPLVQVDETYDSAEEDNWTGANAIDINVANLTLEATGRADRTVIDARGAAANNVINITVDGVTVDGFTIRNTGAGAFDGVNVAGGSANITVKNNIFEAIGQHAVQFAGAHANPIVEDNTMRNIGTDGVFFGGVVTGAKVNRNDISPGIGGAGINFAGNADGSTLEDNVIDGTGGAAIRYAGTANTATLSLNRISSPGGRGIDIGGNANAVTIDGNTIENAGGDGMNLNLVDNGTIRNNTVTDAAGDAIELANTAVGATITGNILTHCGNHGISFSNAGAFQNLTISNNEITSMDSVAAVAAIDFNAGTTGYHTINITGNRIVGNSNGIIMRLAAGAGNDMRFVTIQDNAVRDNGFADGPITVVGNRDFGIQLTTAGGIGACEAIAVSNNTIAGNEIGLDIDDASGNGNIYNVNVTGNLFLENKIGVTVANQNNRINQNDFTGHSQHGYGVDGSNIAGALAIQVNAENNWWGDASGPSHLTNPTGQGDAVTNHVDFSPWGTSSYVQYDITLNNTTIPCDAAGSMDLSTNCDLVADLQIGNGGGGTEIRIDNPNKIDFLEIVGVDPYEVASQTASETATYITIKVAIQLKPGGIPRSGILAQIHLKGTGVLGDTCTATFVPDTGIDVLRDELGNDITHTTVGGTVTLGAAGAGATGDVNGDGTVDITDARWVAEYAIGIRAFTAAQKATADVAPPHIPPDTNVDITDARWIAEAAIGIRTLSVMAVKIAPMAVSGTAQVAINEAGQLVVSGSTAELADIQGTLYYDPMVMNVTDVIGLNGFRVLASSIDSTAGEVKFAAAKLSGSMVVGGPILQFEGGGNLTKAVLDIDVLRDVRARNVPVKLAISVSGLDFGNYPNPITDVHTTTFEVKGLMAALVEAVKVQIFDLSGRLVYESGEVAGTSLDWHTDNDYGEYLSNGVYLYKLYALINDQWVISETKKLVILR